MFELQACLVAQGHILFTRQIGVQTPEGIVREIRKLSKRYPEHAYLSEIVDLSALKGSKMNFASIQQVVQMTCDTAHPQGSGKKIAVFAPDDISYGLTRMHASWLEIASKQIVSAAFRTEVEVLDWLERPERSFAELQGIERLAPVADLTQVSSR
jgi:hypothetical protein